jgi:hypothetical protein
MYMDRAYCCYKSLFSFPKLLHFRISSHIVVRAACTIED